MSLEKSGQKIVNCLYISYDGMTDPLGQSQVLPYLVGMTKNNIKFHLISFEKEERYKKNAKTIETICEKAGIAWHPMMYTKKPPLLSTMYDLMRMKRLAKRLQQHHLFEIVHCRSYIAALVGLTLKNEFATKFVFDMRGFWADERIDGGIWNLKNPVFNMVYKFFKKKEILFLKRADHVISLTYTGKEEIESWFRAEEDKPKITVIPCCADLNLFNPSAISTTDQNSLKQALNISEEAYILGYIGSIGTWYLLEEMLNYFHLLLQKNPRAIFLFVTQENPDKIIQVANMLDIPEEKLRITACNHEKVPLHISILSAAIFFIRPSYSKKASSPTKLGEIMAMGIPVICNSGVGDTDTIVSSFKAGKLFDLKDLKSLTPEETIEISFEEKQAKHGAQSYFGLENGVQKYLHVYNDILSKADASKVANS